MVTTTTTMMMKILTNLLKTAMMTTTTKVMMRQNVFCRVFQELEITVEEDRRLVEELRGNLTLSERKRIAIQTELDDLRALLDAVKKENSFHFLSLENISLLTLLHKT